MVTIGVTIVICLTILLSIALLIKPLEKFAENHKPTVNYYTDCFNKNLDDMINDN